MGDYQSLGGGLRIFDISDPTTPTLVGSLDLPYPVFYMAVAGDTFTYKGNLKSCVSTKPPG
jgi:hypothetical protein